MQQLILDIFVFTLLILVGFWLFFCFLNYYLSHFFFHVRYISLLNPASLRTDKLPCAGGWYEGAMGGDLGLQNWGHLRKWDILIWGCVFWVFSSDYLGWKAAAQTSLLAWSGFFLTYNDSNGSSGIILVLARCKRKAKSNPSYISVRLTPRNQCWVI